MGKKSEPMSESYFYILLCLSKGPMHGYGIMQMTSEISENEVTIGSGTMYGATSNMMKKGWIEETIPETNNIHKKRMYQLTPLGKEALYNEIARLNRMLQGVEKISGK